MELLSSSLRCCCVVLLLCCVCVCVCVCVCLFRVQVLGFVLQRVSLGMLGRIYQLLFLERGGAFVLECSGVSFRRFFFGVLCTVPLGEVRRVSWALWCLRSLWLVEEFQLFAMVRYPTGSCGVPREPNNILNYGIYRKLSSYQDPYSLGHIPYSSFKGY